MKKLVLHVGAHKTGTTSLQRWLQENSGMLAGHGVNYHLLTKEVRAALYKRLEEQSPGKLGKLAEYVAGDFPTEGLVLVSWEGFLGPAFNNGRLYGSAAVAAKILAEVRDLIGCPLEVVFYVRRQDTFINSSYIQAVKEGRASSIHTWIESIDFYSLDWNKPIEALRSAGIPVSVGFYEMMSEDAGTFAAPLLSRLDNSAITIAELDRLNVSYSDRALKMHELINAKFDLSPEENRSFRQFLTARVEGTAPVWNYGKAWWQVSKVASQYNVPLVENSDLPPRLAEYYLFKNK